MDSQYLQSVAIKKIPNNDYQFLPIENVGLVEKNKALDGV